MNDLISRQAAIDALANTKDLVDVTWTDENDNVIDSIEEKRNIIANWLEKVPTAQPEIIRCKDCKFGEQDEVGRWFCRSLGCQIGNEDGSGFCADAERRTDETD